MGAMEAIPSDVEHNSENDSREEGGPSEKSPTAKESLTKRRTKTGCLTCRKRRIKCGEERPICKNCIKSKRECAGYNHPLVYKPHGQGNTQPTSGPTSIGGFVWTSGQSSNVNASHNYSNPIQSSMQFPVATANGYSWDGVLTGSTSSDAQLKVNAHSNTRRTTDSVTDLYDDSFQWSHTQFAAPEVALARTGNGVEIPSNTFTASNIPSVPNGGFTLVNLPGQSRNLPVVPNLIPSGYGNLGSVQRPPSATEALPQIQVSYSVGSTISFKADCDDPNDPWDVVSDEDEASAAIQWSEKSGGRDDLNAANVVSDLVNEKSAQSKALLARRNRYTSSPLLDERSRDIFKHFISVTGPCIGAFDQYDCLHSAGSTLKMVWTHSIPTMAFQCPALAHAILAVSAIHMFKLNLGSENVAVKHFTHALRQVGIMLGDRDQRLEVSTLATVLLLGYYEVMVGDHSRWNLHLSGAGKLVMEHDYAGMTRANKRMRAKANFNIAHQRMQSQVFPKEGLPDITDVSSNLLDEKECQIDQKLISRLMGCDVNYDTQVQLNFRPASDTRHDLNAKNLGGRKVLVELYWWYCKQDVFMSMLSGDQLLLPYPQWKYCPPRGPLDNASNAHTTLDHLWLILARLADFGGKDRKRKQRVVNAQGGHWSPAPGFLDPVPSLQSSKKSKKDMNETHRYTRPSANEGRARTSRPGSEQSPTQPPFYGMIPPLNREIGMSSSFKFMNAELRSGYSSSLAETDSPRVQDLEAQTRHALNEHASITEAFDLFESCLGPDYQPVLPSDIQITTPFGSALQYKTPMIATMWTFFLAGRILLRRLHPHSPPAAMVSASVNAHITRDSSQMLGRICGGLFVQHNYLLQARHVDTALSAAVIETTFSLLFAAVQFEDPVQRGWTISKLSEIAHVTGWQTAASVAGACESMWEKAGMAGKGPPYHKTMDRNNADVRLNGGHRYGQTQPLSTTNMSQAEEHESRFVSHDRNLINKHASTRAHWALGLLSAEEDLQRISISEGG